MKAIATRVLKSVSVEEESTTFTFKPVNGSYTSECLKVDGQFNVKPGQTVLITVTNVETE